MDTKNIYGISLLSFFAPGIPPFFLTLAFILIFSPLMIYTYGTEKQMGAWVVSIFWIGFTGIPPLVLHVNYFICDCHKHLNINNKNQLLILSTRNNKQIVKYEEIEMIEKIHSKSLEGKTISKIHWHTYYYYKIVVKNKEPIYISRMILKEFEKKIKGIYFTSKRVPYPFIRQT